MSDEADTPKPCLTDHTAEFGDGTYRFWMTLREFKAFEAGEQSFFAFYWQLSQAIGIDGDGKFVYTASNGPPVGRIVEFLRLALIGGNHAEIGDEERDIGPIEAKRLVEQYCFPERPIEESAALAFNIAHAAIYGNEAHRAAEVARKAA